MLCSQLPFTHQSPHHLFPPSLNSNFALSCPSPTSSFFFLFVCSLPIYMEPDGYLHQGLPFMQDVKSDAHHLPSHCKISKANYFLTAVEFWLFRKGSPSFWLQSTVYIITTMYSNYHHNKQTQCPTHPLSLPTSRIPINFNRDSIR